jgi:hypothetical protein
VEIEGFAVGQDAEAAATLDVLFFFFDATFFFRKLFVLLPLFPPHCDPSSSKSKKVSVVYYYYNNNIAFQSQASWGRLELKPNKSHIRQSKPSIIVQYL